METDPMERVKASLNALERLRQAEPHLTADQEEHLDRAKESLRESDFPEAKAAIVNMLESTQKPEELVLALAQVLVMLGEDDVRPLADYLESGRGTQE